MTARRTAVSALVATLLIGSAGTTRAGGSGSAIHVTTFDDEIVTDGDCSLREAVLAANTDAPVDACVAGGLHDAIFLTPGSYELTIPGADEDAGLTGDLDLLGITSIDVDGPVGTVWATIDGGGLDRIFDVHPGAVVTGFRWLVLVNGDAGDGEGGAIRIVDSTCDVDGFAGGRSAIGPLLVERNRARMGGGLHFGACGDPEVRSTSIIGNVATDVGGGVSVTGRTWGHIETSTISGNTAANAGGGIWEDQTEASTSVELVTIADNAAPVGAGAWSTFGALNTQSTIVAMNDGPNCGTTEDHVIFALADDDTCGALGHADAGLLPLTRIGNVVVHPLADASPAIDIGGVPTLWCGSISRGDQVGTLRPTDGDGDGIDECDYGAIEHAAVPFVGPPPGAEPEEPTAQPLPNTAVPEPIGSMPLVVTGIVICAVAIVASRRRTSRPAARPSS